MVKVESYTKNDIVFHVNTGFVQTLQTFAIVMQLIFYLKNVINYVILLIQFLNVYNVKCFSVYYISVHKS